jgi:hypothetical protein
VDGEGRGQHLHGARVQVLGAGSPHWRVERDARLQPEPPGRLGADHSRPVRRASLGAAPGDERALRYVGGNEPHRDQVVTATGNAARRRHRLPLADRYDRHVDGTGEGRHRWSASVPVLALLQQPLDARPGLELGEDVHVAADVVGRRRACGAGVGP